jgi:hypothetical protein
VDPRLAFVVTVRISSQPVSRQVANRDEFVAELAASAVPVL